MNPSSFANTAIEQNLESKNLQPKQNCEHIDLNELDKPVLSKEINVKDAGQDSESMLVSTDDTVAMDSLDSPILVKPNDEQEINRSYENTNRFEGVHLPRNNGEWSGVPGNSDWKPDGDYVPQSKNPDGKPWSEILERYDIDSIPFNDGYPDFSDIAEETIEIEDFTENRDLNFTQADRATAEKWNEEGKDGRTDWKASEVKLYRKENDLTWHECEDTKTLQLVPSELHNNVPHSGGISEKKQQS